MFLISGCLSGGQAAAQENASTGTETAATDPFVDLLRKRVEQNPDHSDSWRLIGKLETKNGNWSEAKLALMRALRLDSENAAAHFDMGELLVAMGDANLAARHFGQCAALAPKSTYAEKLYERGDARRPAAADESRSRGIDAMTQFAVGNNSTNAGATKTVGYEIQSFDGSDDLDRRVDQLRSDADTRLKRLRVFLETGVLYNSNVSLTPISRELAKADAESLQFVFNPELEWIAIQRGPWRTGPLARGYFSVNESSQSEFDLASFQGGAFLERDLNMGQSEWIARADYVYALDMLSGDRLGDRHSITASVIAIRPDLDVIYTYITTSFSQFDDDGADPAINSLDGDAITGGISRFFQTGSAWAPTYSLGIDLSSADTEGSDFRFRSITGHGDVTFQLSQNVSLIPTFGVGQRDYYDFTGPVDRDELTWRLHGKLRWKMDAMTSISVVAGHDRFASDNEDFDAERTQGGVIVTVNR
ncbi:MAG: outer membrane beta-barrel protein [Pirellulaceae bacterium]|nr:outer membrane beta-barrel protein [Pirellulaceae bacterium]